MLDVSSSGLMKQAAETEGKTVQFRNQNGWRELTVHIKLPDEKVCQKEVDVPILDVRGVYHRSLVEVITMAFQDKSAKSFHYTPFTQFWKATPESSSEHIYSEIYNSDVFIEKNKKIKSLPPEPGPEYRPYGLFGWDTSSSIWYSFAMSAIHFFW